MCIPTSIFLSLSFHYCINFFIAVSHVTFLFFQQFLSDISKDTQNDVISLMSLVSCSGVMNILFLIHPVLIHMFLFSLVLL